MVKETKRFSLKYLPGIGCVFQSPLGEVVKETFATREMYGGGEKGIGVSIPSRGSGKGDPITGINMTSTTDSLFQSPLGEVVKETQINKTRRIIVKKVVSIPSRGSGKGDCSAREPYPERVSSLKSTHHFLPVNKTVKPAISSVACNP